MRQHQKRKRLPGTKKFFLHKMEELLEMEMPDLIVCTHGFPSHLISQLKKTGKCTVPAINVYTDYFINSVWGVDCIDLHLLPSQDVKNALIRAKGIDRNKLIVTGIPVHEEFSNCRKLPKESCRSKILVSGGNSGLGRIVRLLVGVRSESSFDFLVLCGKNRKLYDEIKSWNVSHIQPLPYISSKKAMNEQYERADAIITKPGGVTISEALHKKLPIFVYSALPGQEEVNLAYLNKKKLIFQLDQSQSIEAQIANALNNKMRMERWGKAATNFLNGIEIQQPKEILNAITSLIKSANHYDLRVYYENGMPGTLYTRVY